MSLLLEDTNARGLAGASWGAPSAVAIGEGVQLVIVGTLGVRDVLGDVVEVTMTHEESPGVEGAMTDAERMQKIREHWRYVELPEADEVYWLLSRVAALEQRVGELEAERLSDIRKVRQDEHEKTLRARSDRDALAARLQAVEGALAPFASGGSWGKWKALLVDGADELEMHAEGLEAAQQITAWQVKADAALARPATPTEGEG